MAAINKRIYYAMKLVGIGPIGTASFAATNLIHGVQSIGVTTTFNLEQIFELGQLAIYENIENIPDVEVTMERVLDGYAPAYLKATQGAGSATLAGRQNQRSIVALGVFSDLQDSTSGVPLAEAHMSGLYPSALTYTFPVEGQATESLTLVGNHKVWRSGAPLFMTSLSDALNTNTDSPMSLAGSSGGVQRREDVLFYPINTGLLVHVLDANYQLTSNMLTILPRDIHGISGSGTNDRNSAGDFDAHIQNITVSANLGRESIFELGRKAPYHRYATFPIEVTLEVETIATIGDMVSATEEGIYSDGTNLKNQSARIRCREGLLLDLGTKLKLSSVAHAGGDTGGGNTTSTYSYSTFNDLTVQHPQDPTTALRPTYAA